MAHRGVEQKYPLRVERTAPRVDSGGDGRLHGGLGLRREVRLLAPADQVSVLSEKKTTTMNGSWILDGSAHLPIFVGG